MIIWKSNEPYIVKEIDDLKHLVEEDVFEAMKDFLDDYIDSSDTVEKLEDELESLEYEVMELEQELEQTSQELDELKEEHELYDLLLKRSTEFLESISHYAFNKDQTYYLDQLQDILNRADM